MFTPVNVRIMSPEESPYPHSLWKRWDSDDPDGEGEPGTLPERRFFEFCAVPLAGDSFAEGPRPASGDGGESGPEERPADAGESGSVETALVSFLPPATRLLLRHVPTMVALFLVAVLVEAELRPAVSGISTVLPELPLVPLVYLGLAVCGLVVVLVRSGIVDGPTAVRALFIYGLTGVLLAGSVYGTVLTLETRRATETTPHVVYTFPTLLFTLLVGLLAYDLLMKGERLYTRFGKKNIVTAHGATGLSGGELYERIKREELLPKLDETVGPFRYGHVFAILVLSVYLLIWSFKGPLGTGLWSSFLLNLTINLVVLVGVFNFLVGVLFLRKLLNGKYSHDGVALQPGYLPFHPDRQGGFADIGRLAMRINVIFILIGAYYTYRAYISGIRTFPARAELPFDPLYAEVIGVEQTSVLEMVFWVINFIGPVVLYALVVAVWFYYTFWEIHRVMANQKKELILERQSDRLESDEYPEATVDSPLGEYEYRDDWQALYDAPEWPVNTQKLGGLITGNVLPILFSIPTVVPDLLAAWG